MATPQEQRKIRLKNDYKEMQNIKGAIISWKPLVGTAPYIEQYELTVNVRTIIDSDPSYREKHVIRVTLPAGYPFRAAPDVVMISKPKPFHPNWFSNGKWCFGTHDISEGLGHHIIRMIKTLQYDLDITNEHSPADGTANCWYVSNKHSGLFPCDKSVLPDPTKSKFNVKTSSASTKKFVIK